ncbi:MAG: hypothetical protein IPJ97_19700 [Proteobacteria bacterium]|nr:hypothetical protein [Pseudomonadota bacterium]
MSLDGAWGKDNKSILKPRRNKDFPVMAHHNGIDGSTTMLLHWTGVVGFAWSR